ncbi:MAG: hypothetical protein H0Z28_06245 [Archaeoglobus sp.]|nr:hypothetical protein [Archaeoglobus sp.]
MFEFFHAGVFAGVFAGILVLLSIIFSGFFLWAGLRITGKKAGILEASLVNLAAGVLGVVAGSIVVFIPFLGILSPIVAYLVYLYAISSLLKISILQAFLASILATIVFMAILFAISFFIGIWMLKFIPFGFRPGMMHF